MSKRREPLTSDEPSLSSDDENTDDESSDRWLRRQARLPSTTREELEEYIEVGIASWRNDNTAATASAERRFFEQDEAVCVYQIIIPLTEKIRLHYGLSEQQHHDDFASAAIEWFRRYARTKKHIERYIDDDDTASESMRTSALLTNTAAARPKRALAGIAAVCVFLAAKEYLPSRYSTYNMLFLNEEPFASFTPRLLMENETAVIQTLRLGVPTTADFYQLFRALATFAVEQSYELTKHPFAARFHRAALFTAVLQSPKYGEPALQAAVIVSLELEAILGLQRAFVFHAAIGPLLAHAKLDAPPFFSVQNTLMNDIGDYVRSVADGQVADYVRAWSHRYSNARA